MQTNVFHTKLISFDALSLSQIVFICQEQTKIIFFLSKTKIWITNVFTTKKTATQSTVLIFFVNQQLFFYKLSFSVKLFIPNKISSRLPNAENLKYFAPFFPNPMPGVPTIPKLFSK